MKYLLFLFLCFIIKAQGGDGMAEASDTWGILRQNLLDAGCGSNTVQRCMDLIKKGENAELLRLLSHHRRELLDAVHQNEKRIDCLDYLIYQIERTQSPLTGWRNFLETI